MSGLIDAVVTGDLEAAKSAIASGADPNEAQDGVPALFLAARHGHVDIVDVLLQKGASVEARDRFGFPPLMCAVHYGHPDVVALLLKAGASLDFAFEDGEGVLHRACKYGRDARRGPDGQERPLTEDEKIVFVEIARQLLAAGADSSKASFQGTPLELAAESASIGLLTLLLDHGARPGAQPTALTRAITSQLEPYQKLDLLLQRGLDPDAEHALLAAASSHSPDAGRMARRLVEAGADVGAEDFGWTALTWAVVRGNVDLIKLLLEKGARANVKIKADLADAGLRRGMTALDIAKEWGHADIAALLEQAEASKGKKAGAAKGKKKAASKFERDRFKGFFADTFCVLLAGKVVREEVTLGQAKKLCLLTEAWSQKLGKLIKCIPGGDASETGAAQEDGDALGLPLTIGLQIAVAAAEDGEPTAVDIDQMRAQLQAAEQLPDELWAAIKDLLGPRAGEAFGRERAEVWLTSCGPLPAGYLALGEIGSEADASQKGLAWLHGQNMGQEPDGAGVIGREVAQASSDGTLVQAIDVCEAAHEARVKALGALGARAGYFIGARYD